MSASFSGHCFLLPPLFLPPKSFQLRKSYPSRKLLNYHFDARQYLAQKSTDDLHRQSLNLLTWKPVQAFSNDFVLDIAADEEDQDFGAPVNDWSELDFETQDAAPPQSTVCGPPQVELIRRPKPNEPKFEADDGEGNAFLPLTSNQSKWGERTTRCLGF
ncbi:unnamed protein product [Dibothriocephalus latus]|uniref:Uncharacterized protein n=1 Tax=Dibothriocephalus latus TaxID=60516 RepID=A0A3P7M4Y1_DIBLA|nr:unnamed protein product [Dibothriocephalus latus]